MDVDPDLLTLRNVNTPEDYQAALREARLADPAHARLLSDDQPS